MSGWREVAGWMEERQIKFRVEPEGVRQRKTKKIYRKREVREGK